MLIPAAERLTTPKIISYTDMEGTDKKAFKAKLKRQRNDNLRPLRVVKYLEFPYILKDSPVEVEEGYIVTDKDTGDIFASFIFKNVSEKYISALNIKIACYYNQNIPYEYVDFSYNAQDLTFGQIKKDNVEYKMKICNGRDFVYSGESFGSLVLIKIPETYFTKLEIILDSVEYSLGTKEKLDLKVGGQTNKYSDLDNISKLVYSRINLYDSAESVFPTVVIPQFGEKGWLCCCGNKNKNSDEACTICGRERDWQKNYTTAEALETKKIELVSDSREHTLHDKTKYDQTKYLENSEDVRKKMERYEEAMRNIANKEDEDKKRQKGTIIKIIIFFLVAAFLIAALKVLNEFRFGQYVLNGCSVQKVEDETEENGAPAEE